MNKKDRSKKQPTPSSQVPIRAAFTLSALHMLRDALRLFETHLLSTNRPLPHFELATETLAGLKIKLDDMLQREEWDKETGFDYNELHILHAAIHMYLVYLSVEKESPLAISCLTLCKQLRLIIEQV